MRRLLCPLTLATALAFGAGCAGLSPAAKKIVIADKGQVSDCRFLRVVYGGHKGGLSLSPRNEALESAAFFKATHVRVLFDQGGKFTGDAFDCNQKPVARKPDGKQDGKQDGTSGGQTTPASATVTPPPAAPPPPRGPVDTGSWVVAVMDVQAVSKSRELTPSLMRNIGDQLRIFVAQTGVRTVDRSAQETTLKDQLAQLKKDSYQACYDDSCQIELGKALAASHILRTRITRFGRLCVLNGELIDLRSEVATAAASSRGTCEEEGFLRMSEEVAQNLVPR